ncbi:MAG: hypothetical protein K2N74_06005, partial [Clostridiales bacterium]|nr:hypothetical protein [Clostridiales bacterium]
MGKDIQGKKDLTFLPIAHLSPICAFRIKQAIIDAEFDTLFVELPKEAQGLLSALTDGRTKLPVSLLFRSDEAETVLPLTEYSPEYVAVKTASELGKRIVFIDSAAYATAQPRSSAASTAIEEITDSAFDSTEFFETLNDLAVRFASGITEREAAMLREIENTDYTRAVVVAGAVHCVNLKSGVSVAATLRRWEGECYIIPYVPDGSSVVHCGYNAALFKRLGDSADPFTDAATDCLTKLSSKVTADY